MTKIKLSLAVLALTLTVGLSFAKTKERFTFNCSLEPDHAADYNSSNCGTPGGTICCYTPNAGTTFATKLP